MMAAWFVYCTLVAALMAAAAWAGEAALRACDRPARSVWAGAMVASLALPLAGWFGWSGWGGAPPVQESASPAFTAAPILVDLGTSSTAELLDRPLLILWILVSLSVLLVVLGAVHRLRRARAEWRPEVVEGFPVLLSEDTGPAALGFLRGAIVIPEWTLALDGRLRRLLLLHEEEHLLAGDPRLALAALAAPILVPWNPAVWWQFWRLRQALELDCDARVLRRVPDARSYGTLLLEVGRRKSVGSLLAAAFSEPRSFLERRIRMIGKPKSRARLVQAIAGVGASVALVVAACDVKEPTTAGAGAGERAAAVTSGSAGRGVEIAAAGAGASCTPTFYLDGKRIEPARGEGSAAALAGVVDPEAIQSIEVIKGRAVREATGGLGKELAARYPGADPSCGVVVITTKASLQPLSERAGPVRTGSEHTRSAGEGKEAPAMATARRIGIERTGGEALRRQGGARLAREGFVAFTPEMTRPELQNRKEVAEALSRFYPPLLRDAGIGGTAEILFSIDETGKVTHSEITTSKRK